MYEVMDYVKGEMTAIEDYLSPIIDFTNFYEDPLSLFTALGAAMDTCSSDIATIGADA
jgi:hypothetical protein